MRLVLHIGHQKTGSTAIQHAFTENSQNLERRGVLYPLIDRQVGIPYSHASLTPAYLAKIEGRRVTSADTSFAERVWAYCRRIEHEIARCSPDLLILSSEMLFRPLLEPFREQLKSWINSLSDEVSVVSYVRRPSDWFLSSVQQRLRSGAAIGAVRHRSWRPVLETYLSAFGDRLHVTTYDPSAFPNGDVVDDFVGRFAPEVGRLDMSVIAGTNRSSGSEVMAIMQDCIRQGDDQNMLSFEAKINEVARAEGLTTTRPRLHPEVEDYINLSAVDLIWLAEIFGVVFKEIDYERVGTVPTLNMPAYVCVADICELDASIKRRLLTALAAHENAEGLRRNE